MAHTTAPQIQGDRVSGRRLESRAGPTGPTGPAGPVLGEGSRRRAAVILSAGTAVLLAVASGAGLLVDGLYREPASISSVLRGYDLVNLVVVVPALVIGLAGLRRGSARATLLWLSMLAAVVYTGAYHVFLPGFNDLLLVHVAVFGAALFSLVLGLSALDVRALASLCSPRTPVRSVSILLAVLAAGLGGMWAIGSVRFAVTGAVPAGSVLVETDALVHLGIVLDLALLVPVYALSAALLWRRRPWGYALATIVVVSGVVHQLGYVVAMPFQVAAGVPGARPFDPGEPPIAVAFLAAAAVMLASAGRSPRRPAG